LNLNANVGKTKAEKVEANKILNSGRDRSILKLMRDETILLVLMVRVRNQDAQDEYKARRKEQDELEAALDAPLFEEA
jgi:hypothetical protein